MADKSKTIKGATDKELDELLIRMRKESELQSLIGDVKRKSTPKDPYNEEVSYSRPEVSTEQPIESLYHYGILGMRWGVRRKRGPDGRVIPGTRERNTPASEEHRKAQELKKVGAKGLSNQELKTLNQRLQLEKQYRDLDPSSLKKGMNIAKGVVAVGTTVTALHALATSDAAKAVANAFKKVPPEDILKG